MFAPKLIKASAGTGKTFSLTNRFLALLIAGEQPDRILATTFTRKAAGEIQERVVSRLAQAALDSQSASELGAFTGTRRLTCETAGELLISTLNAQHRLHISTLDSFFSELAAGFSFELGLEPGWRIPEQDEERVLQQEAIHAMLQGASLETMTDLVQSLHGGAARKSVAWQLQNQVDLWHELYCETAPEAWQWAEQLAGRFQAESPKEILARLSSIELPKTKQGTPRVNWQKSFLTLGDALERRDWSELDRMKLIETVLADGDNYDRVPIDDDTRSVVRAIARAATKDLLHSKGRELVAAYELMRRFDTELQQVRERSNTLSFNGVKRSLFQRSIWGELDEVYFRLDSALRHILLDEFQDTSHLEWRVLLPLVSEILSKESSEHSFFCVGDAKQAIYRWRGGVAEIFDGLSERWPHLEQEHLELSFRSAPAVIETVNTVFSSLRENQALRDYPEVVSLWGERFLPHATARKKLKGTAQFSFVESNHDDPDEIDPVLEAAAQKVAELHRARPDRSIGVLVRKNDQVGEFLSALEHTAGLSASGEGGIALMASPVVTVIVSALWLCDHPNDSLSAFLVLCSPLGRKLAFSELGQSDRVAAELRLRISNTGFGVVARELGDCLDPYADDRDRFLLQRLVELGFAYDREAGASVSEFIARIKLASVDEQRVSPIRVMTIHRSKGLEFDSVVLPDLDASLTNHHPAVLLSRRQPFEPPYRIAKNIPQLYRPLVPELEEMYRSYRNAELIESLSVLYVALTRARQGLYMFSSRNQASALSFGTILRNALCNGGDQDYEIGTADWLEGDRANMDTTDLREKQGPLNFKPLPEQRVRNLVRVRPSDLHRSRHQLVEDVIGETPEMVRGRLVHRLFEAVEWLDEAVPDRACLEGLLRSLPGAESFDRSVLIEEFYSMIGSSKVALELERRAYADLECDNLAVFRELEFASRQENSIVTGTFDRLVVGRRQGEPVFAEVLDFKTDKLHEPSSQVIEKRVEIYVPQLEEYRRAAALMCHLPIDKVRGKLLFVSIDAVHSW